MNRYEKISELMAILSDMPEKMTYCRKRFDSDSPICKLELSAGYQEIGILTNYPLISFNQSVEMKFVDCDQEPEMTASELLRTTVEAVLSNGSVISCTRRPHSASMSVITLEHGKINMNFCTLPHYKP